MIPHWLIKRIEGVLLLLSEWLEKPEPKPMPSKASLVYDAAFSVLGQDLSQHAPNERGCAEAVSRILKKVYPDFPILVSTIKLNDYLIKSPRFLAIENPIAGCIAIFPSEGKRVGHVGIWGRKGWVMSNSSATGRFESNYTYFGFQQEATRRGLRIYYYTPV